MCDDIPDNDNSTCVQDCEGTWDGPAYIDNCGTCVGGGTGETPCVNDCAGIPGGLSTEDDCGICDDDPGNDNSSCVQDCIGVWDGEAYIDNCGTCVGGYTGRIPCPQDCNNTWGGSAYLDTCDICVGGDTGQIPCTEDCEGTWGGTATTDHCSVCDDYPANDDTTCTQDCWGVWGGAATRDGCGVCNEDPGDDNTACITVDPDTGLVWQQLSEWGGGDGATYDEAVTFCSTLDRAGSTTWRLPTKDELKALIVCDNGTPTPLEDHPFHPNTCSDGNDAPYTQPAHKPWVTFRGSLRSSARIGDDSWMTTLLGTYTYKRSVQSLQLFICVHQ